MECLRIFTKYYIKHGFQVNNLNYATFPREQIVALINSSPTKETNLAKNTGILRKDKPQNTGIH
jgi:hypothetical protein